MRACRALLLWLTLGGVAQAATVKLVNQDDAGEGLNDTTPATPVGSNSGETLGEQRRIALQYAADIVGSRVQSPVTIRISARFDSLGCTPNSASLGQATPANFTLNFSGAPMRDTFYPLALANALAGQRIASGADDIQAMFSSDLDKGSRDCLQGKRWYYGLDNRRPSDQISFLGTAVHELIHGLGFVSLVALQDTEGAVVGQFAADTRGQRHPDIFSRYVKDLALPGQPNWPTITDAQRADSLTNGPDVVWADPVTANAAASVLDAGFNQGYVKLYAPASIRPGSSISHWDTSLSPDAIMEPFTTRTDNVVAGIGLASCVLEKIGWQLTGDVRCPDANSDAIIGNATDRNQGASDDVGGSVSDDGGSGGGGGGCTLAKDARFDPVWPALLGLCVVVLPWRRRRLPFLRH